MLHDEADRHSDISFDLGFCPGRDPPSKVTFRKDGITLVNGKPFFPIGIYLYDLNGPVMADLHEQRFNTIIGNGFHADQLDFIHQHGMMFVPFSTDEFVNAGKDNPGLLAWYLQDEPESGHTAEKLKEAYDHLKAKDPNHPIGLDHYLFEALTQFKDDCNFTMTDVYPILANRDGPIQNVGVFVDEAGDPRAKLATLVLHPGFRREGHRRRKNGPNRCRMKFAA